MQGLSLLAACLALSAVVSASTSSLRRRRAALEDELKKRTRELADSQRQLEASHQQQEESSRQLGRATLLDPLTALPNRLMFNEGLTKLVNAARRSNGVFGLLLLDLDGFKAINQAFGHDAGDAVLIEVARRLVAAVRGADGVARLGADEFGVLLAGGAEQQIEQVCKRILERFDQPVLFLARAMEVTPSIGVALFPKHGATLEEIYRSADLALGEARSAGGRTFRWHAPGPAP